MIKLPLCFKILMKRALSHFTFFLLSDEQCKKLPAYVMSEWKSFYSRTTVSDLFTCIDEAMWYICHSVFPKCVFDETKKVWEIVKVCKESCLAFAKTPSCKAVIPDRNLIVTVRKKCERVSVADELYCIGQPNSIESYCLSSSRGE